MESASLPHTHEGDDTHATQLTTTARAKKRAAAAAAAAASAAAPSSASAAGLPLAPPSVDSAAPPEEGVAPSSAATIAAPLPHAAAAESSSTNVYCSALPLSWTEDDLYARFLPFGRIKTVKLLIHPGTQHSKGAGFVHFEQPESAAAAIRALHRTVPVEMDPQTGEPLPAQQPPGVMPVTLKVALAHAGTAKQQHQQQQQQQQQQANSMHNAYGMGGPAMKTATRTVVVSNQPRPVAGGAGFPAQGYAPQDEPGFTLYCAGLPKQVTKNQVLQVFSPYGRIVNVKLLTDPVSMQQRGIAFVKFEQPADAQWAISQLNQQPARIGGEDCQLSVKIARAQQPSHQSEQLLANQFAQLHFGQRPGGGGGGGGPRGMAPQPYSGPSFSPQLAPHMLMQPYAGHFAPSPFPPPPGSEYNGYGVLPPFPGAAMPAMQPGMAMQPTQTQQADGSAATQSMMPPYASYTFPAYPYPAYPAGAPPPMDAASAAAAAAASAYPSAAGYPIPGYPPHLLLPPYYPHPMQAGPLSPAHMQHGGSPYPPPHPALLSPAGYGPHMQPFFPQQQQQQAQAQAQAAAAYNYAVEQQQHIMRQQQQMQQQQQQLQQSDADAQSESAAANGDNGAHASHTPSEEASSSSDHAPQENAAAEGQ